jgi:hypothetical protein
MSNGIRSRLTFVTVENAVTKVDKKKLKQQPEGFWKVEQFFPTIKKRETYRFFSEKSATVVHAGTEPFKGKYR